MQAVERSVIRGYSAGRLRFLFAMVGRRAFQMVNGPASHAIMRPMVVLAARALGPGPTRLKLVKLAHSLSSHRATVIELPRGGQDLASAPSQQPTRRAA